MVKYSHLYGLYALTSIALFNCLVLLARYARVAKMPPQDPEFEAILKERDDARQAVDLHQAELTNLQALVGRLEDEKTKLEETIKMKNEEIEGLKNPGKGGGKKSAA